MAANKQIVEVNFRLATINDLNELFEIESQVHSHPWTRNTLLSCFGKLSCNVVALYQGEVAGYIFCRVVAGEAELLNISVALKLQGLGIGEQLMTYLKALLKEQEAEALWLEVRETNLRAQSLYEQHNFHLVERRKAYYPTKSGREDALIMSCYL